MSNISENHQFIMKGEIQSAFGFFKFYFENLGFYSNNEQCFEYCNYYFRSKYGYDRYESFEKFKYGNAVQDTSIKKPKIIQPVQNKIESSLEILEREYLLTWSKSKGFDTWTSFKALVMHYYPATDPEKLYGLWKSKTLDAETQKNVGYVKQIIGE